MDASMEELAGLIDSQVTKAESILSFNIRSVRDLRNLEAEARKWDLLNRDILRSSRLTGGFLVDYERVANEHTAGSLDLRSSVAQLQEVVRARLEVLCAARDRVFRPSGALTTGIDAKNTAKIKIFLVHGHDLAFLYEVKDYLQNILGLPEPIVLSQQPSGGRTVIEKFEDYASRVDAAVVLLSPDDVGGKTEGALAKRARQNVIFELGFFLGQFGRRSGRVILLYKKGVDIPSDLAGIIYIEVDSGVQAVGESIRRELGLLQGKI